MAIEDGAILARCLAKTTNIWEALVLYQHNRIDRTARIVNTSTANRSLYHSPDQNEIRAYLRDEASGRNKEIYAYNPLNVPLLA